MDTFCGTQMEILEYIISGICNCVLFLNVTTIQGDVFRCILQNEQNNLAYLEISKFYKKKKEK